MIAKLDVGAARSITFSPDGEFIAVGMKNGEFLVLATNGMKLWGKRRDRGGSINDIRWADMMVFRRMTQTTTIMLSNSKYYDILNRNMSTYYRIFAQPCTFSNFSLLS